MHKVVNGGEGKWVPFRIYKRFGVTRAVSEVWVLRGGKQGWRNHKEHCTPHQGIWDPMIKLFSSFIKKNLYI